MAASAVEDSARLLSNRVLWLIVSQATGKLMHQPLMLINKLFLYSIYSRHTVGRKKKRCIWYDMLTSIGLARLTLSGRECVFCLYGFD